MKHLFILTLLSLSMSCQTSNYVVQLEAANKKASIQSQSDLGSAIYALNQSGSLNPIKRTLDGVVSVSKSKRTKVVLNQSQVHLAEGNLEKAEELCRRVLKTDLKNQEARLILAQIYYRRGYHEMSQIILNGLGKWSESDSRVLNLNALISLKNDLPSRAMFLFKKSLKINPNHISTRMNLGSLYIRYRQLSNASIQFERVLQVMPNNIDAKLHLAIIFSSRGEYDRAYDLYEEVLNVHPNNALASFNMAILEEKKGDYPKAMSYLKTYLSSDYSKKNDSNEVYSMVQRLKTKSEMQGKSINSDDLESIVDLKKKRSVEFKKHVELEKEGSFRKSDDDSSNKNDESNAVSSPKDSSMETMPATKTIEDLEKVLMQ